MASPILDIPNEGNRTACDLCPWILSLRMFSRFLQITACVSTSFLDMAGEHGCTDPPAFVGPRLGREASGLFPEHIFPL